MSQLYEVYRYLVRVQSRAEVGACAACAEVNGEVETMLASCVEVLEEMLFFDQRMRGEVAVDEAWCEACREAKLRLQALQEKVVPCSDSPAYRVACLLSGDALREVVAELQQVVQRVGSAAAQSPMAASLGAVVSKCEEVHARAVSCCRFFSPCRCLSRLYRLRSRRSRLRNRRHQRQRERRCWARSTAW